MFSLQLNRSLLGTSLIPRLIFAAPESTSNKDEIPANTRYAKKLENAKKHEESRQKDKISDHWRKREKLAVPKIQRFEEVPPKNYWVEDWKLELEEGKRGDEKYSPLKNYGTNTKKWDYYNTVIWPPNYVVPETGLPKAREVFHTVNSIHYSPKRMWYVCHFVRRMMVDEAIKQLKFKENKGTIIMANLLTQAKKRAKEEFYIEDPSKMFVAEAFPIQKFIFYGARRHAHNQIAKRRFRYIDVFVRLEEGHPPPYKGRGKPLDGWDKMEKYYEYLRQRDFKYSL